jgi:hypothetical protein
MTLVEQHLTNVRGRKRMSPADRNARVLSAVQVIVAEKGDSYFYPHEIDYQLGIRHGQPDGAPPPELTISDVDRGLAALSRSGELREIRVYQLLASGER